MTDYKIEVEVPFYGSQDEANTFANEYELESIRVYSNNESCVIVGLQSNIVMYLQDMYSMTKDDLIDYDVI